MAISEMTAEVTVSADSGRVAQARRLARHLALPLAAPASRGGYRLHLGTERLELRQLSDGAPGPVFVDFCGGRVDHRRRFGGGKHQPLARAVGLHQRPPGHVIDATAGLGRDAFVLASLGCTVTLLERSPVFAALLEDGLRRARLNPDTRTIAGRMHLHHVDSRCYLAALSAGQRPDAVLLDPMYPHRSKSALVKKEMRAARALVGDDGDAGELLKAARRAARYRVAVKRPKGATPLAGLKPDAVIQSQNTRYDIYVNTAGQTTDAPG